MVSNLVFFKGKKLKTWNSRYKLSLISISPNNNKSFKHAFRINARIHAFAQLRLTWTLNNQKFRGERRISIRLVSSSKWAAALNYKTILVSTYFRSYLRIIHAEILVDPRKLCAVGFLFPERNNIIGPKHFQHLRTYFDSTQKSMQPSPLRRIRGKLFVGTSKMDYANVILHYPYIWSETLILERYVETNT